MLGILGGYEDYLLTNRGTSRTLTTIRPQSQRAPSSKPSSRRPASQSQIKFNVVAECHRIRLIPSFLGAEGLPLRSIGRSPGLTDPSSHSHAHFDHCRPISRTFRNAVAWFGPGTREFCTPGHLADPTSFWDGRFFDPEDRATERWQTFLGPWMPFGSFPHAMDFLGDGSLWIIQAPGHMPGNLCACARLASGDWILLGSDCCHSRYDPFSCLLPTAKMRAHWGKRRCKRQKTKDEK